MSQEIDRGGDSESVGLIELSTQDESLTHGELRALAIRVHNLNSLHTPNQHFFNIPSDFGPEVARAISFGR